MRYTCLGSFYAIVFQSTSNTLFYYVLFVIIIESCFSHKFRTNFFVIISNTNIFAVDKYMHNLTTFDRPHTEKTERWSPIGDRLIVVREIATLI